MYAFAPPCIANPELCAMTSPLITSLVCSHDIVSRLSLGTVRDIRNAAYWLCEDGSVPDGSSGNVDLRGFAEVTKRASAWKSGAGLPGDEEWVSALFLIASHFAHGIEKAHCCSKDFGSQYAECRAVSAWPSTLGYSRRRFAPIPSSQCVEPLRRIDEVATI